jgi:hypothetical protein
MVALVDDQMAVAVNRIGYDAFAYEALHQRDVDLSRRFAAPAADRSDFACIHG